jgi:hypothetical protein
MNLYLFLNKFSSYFNINNIKDHILKICKLIYLHPLFIDLWIQLGDLLIAKIADINLKNEDICDITKYLIDCYFIVKELIKHGYKYRSDIVLNQKNNQKLWV